MTYIDRINALTSWCETDRPPDRVVVLALKLLALFNRRGWPEWAGVDTPMLMHLVGTDNKATAFRTRDALVKAGFLEHRKGKRGMVSEYRLLDFGFKFDTNPDTNNETNHDTNPDTKSDTHRATQSDTPNKTYKTKTYTPPYNPPPPGGGLVEVHPDVTPEQQKRKRFTPPEVDEVAEYCASRRNGIDPEAFVDFYASKGWLVGKTPMKDWKAAVRTWERNRREKDGGEGDRKTEYFRAPGA